MTEDRELHSWFERSRRELEEGYLAHDDPIRQSGFSGGVERWRREREPILEGVHKDGDLLDVGCANGYLLECLVGWARELGINLVPFGLDFSAKLIELARRRMPEHSASLFVGNAWDWSPPRMFDFVYVLIDCVPEAHMRELTRRLHQRAVAPGGRLIAGHYGSRSRGTPPLPVPDILAAAGLHVAGTAWGGNPPITRFAWVDK